MRTNGAFDRARPGDRLRSRWYGMSRAARVNKLLFLAAGISLVAFVNVANRGSDPSTALSAGRATRTPLSMAGPSSTDLQAAALPTGEAPLPPPVASTTTSSRPLTTARATTTAAPRRAPSPTTGNPGAADRAPSTTVAPTTAPPTTAPPTTGAPATTTTAAPTTTAPTTTAAPPPSSSTTTTTTGRSVLQILFGG